MKYKCCQCGAVIDSDIPPSSRLCKPNVQTGPNQFESSNQWVEAGSNYSTICFGGERGEDYYRHDWMPVIEPALNGLAVDDDFWNAVAAAQD